MHQTNICPAHHDNGSVKGLLRARCVQMSLQMLTLILHRADRSPEHYNSLNAADLLGEQSSELQSAHASQLPAIPFHAERLLVVYGEAC
jgi:hypothetical protein